MALVNSLAFNVPAVIRSTISEIQLAEIIPHRLIGVRRTVLGFCSGLRKGVARVSTEACLPIVKAVARKLADAALPAVESKTKELLKHAMVLERAQELLIEEMVLTQTAGAVELIAPIEQLEAVNRKRIAEIDQIVQVLHGMNDDSRLAVAYMRLRVVIQRIDAAVAGIKVICQPGEHAMAVLSRLHALQAGVDAKLATYMDDEEFDPELAALADAALERIGQNSQAAAR